MPSTRPAGASDFDFLIGNWHIENRRLKERLVECREWETFEASLSVRPALDGLGNVDEFRAVFRGRRIEALTLRVFNPETTLWSLYWVDSLTAELQAPVVGRFQGGLGEFFCDDRHQGRPVRLRFRWSDIHADSARWEQAFSVDGGRSWETNWIMLFSRRPA